MTVAISKTSRDALQAKWSAVSIGGYQVSSGDALYNYKKLIGDMAEHFGAKRQTPLVNAGYAMRIAVMLHSIQKFLRFQRAFCRSLQRVQIIILGAGLDVTGFWVLSQLSEDDQVHLVEVDLHSVAQAKRDALLELSWAAPAQLPSDDNKAKDTSVWQGCPLVGKGKCRYSLVQADLGDVSKLQESLSIVQLGRPTLIISELVLAYLPPDRCNDLMKWCSVHLCTHPMSCLLAFEPLGQSQDPIMSVLSGYKQQYVSQFTAKLDRGHADSLKGSSFHPLGTDCASVIARMRDVGWTRTRALLVGDAAVEATREGIDLSCQEVFDEHAALALHLQSYTLVIGFLQDSESLLRRYMCTSAADMYPVSVVVGSGSAKIWITEIEPSDEQELRHHFSFAYQKYFNTYPVIKKMVKTALRKDLGSSISDDDEMSKIHRHYLSIEGHFLVAVQYPPTSYTTGLTRTVLGGIGWRRLLRKERVARGFQTTSFEIHRLVVAPRSRRLGIARCLLQRAEEMMQREASFYQIIASTPSLLEDATSFYRGTDFELIDETEMGNVNLLTFTKTVDLRKWIGTSTKFLE
jgi:O-methyltransferase involved in polyketide biosynthesis/GNAT superfamily N-acetyltransferase